MSNATAAKRTPAQQRMYDEGRADAAAGRKPSPPTMGGALERAYLEGFAAGATSRKGPTAARRSGAARARRSGSRGAGSRPAARGRALPAPVRAGGRRAAAPVRSAVVNGVSIAATAVALAFLYNLLTHATAGTRAIDLLFTPIRWLNSNQPIPHKP